MILILVVTLSLADSGDSHRASDSHPEVMGICGIKNPNHGTHDAGTAVIARGIAR